MEKGNGVFSGTGNVYRETFSIEDKSSFIAYADIEKSVDKASPKSCIA